MSKATIAACFLSAMLSQSSATMCFENLHNYQGGLGAHIWCCSTTGHYFMSRDYICFAAPRASIGPEYPGSHGYTARCRGYAATDGYMVQASDSCYCAPKAYRHKWFSSEVCWEFSGGNAELLDEPIAETPAQEITELANPEAFNVTETTFFTVFS